MTIIETPASARRIKKPRASGGRPACGYVNVIRSEKRSGTTTTGREEPRTVLEFLRSGDVLMVTRMEPTSPGASETFRTSCAP